MWLLPVLLVGTVLPSAHALIDEGACPTGWQSTGDICVRPLLIAKDISGASKNCEAIGGHLLPTHDDIVLGDVADLLKSLFDSGLLESTWLVGGDDTRRATAMQRDQNGDYRITSVSVSAAYPFLCSLTHIARRKLLFQQQLIAKGAPKLSGPTPSFVYFYTRQYSDYVALPCQAEGEPAPKITWYKNDVEMVSPSSHNSSYLLSGGTLLVPASRDLSYTTFHCTATNALGTVRGPSILLKPAFMDAFPPHRLDVFPLLDGGARIDCQAPAHQPKSLSFVWYIGGTTERIKKQDERVFISLDGTLYFSYVTEEDDNKYACSLSLPSMASGHYGPFFRFRVPPSAVTEHAALTFGAFAPRLDANHPQVFPEQPEQGDTVYLECFAYGNPLPSYRWSRVDGKPLSKRATVINYGRILKIDNAQSTDQTRYKCSASNSVGMASGEVTLILRARPTILLPLSDRLVSPAFQWSLECPLPSSDLASQVEWFHDGRPIVPLLMPPEQRKRFLIDHHVLHVHHTTFTDAGIYECLVTNDVGVASSSCLVSVQETQPEFPPHAMPTKVFAVKGSPLSLPCVYRASPVGVSQWTDGGGTVLPPRGRVRDWRGSLVIDEVMQDDAGLFFCTAKNEIGKAHAAVKLIVLEKPEVRAKSTNHLASGSVNITCEVELDCENEIDCPEAQFAWNLNDSPLKGMTKHGMKAKLHTHKHKHSRTIQQNIDLQMPVNMDKSKVGRFSCTSIFGGAEVPTKGTPPAPIKVNALNPSHQGVELTWRMPPQHRETRHNGPSIDGYLVEMRTRRDRRWRSAPRQMIVRREGEEGVKMERLRPNDYYQFRIRSIDSGTVGDPSAPTDWVRTQPEAPKENIEGLKWRPLDKNTLLVEWDAVEKEHPSGEHLRYKVSWSEGPSEISPSSSSESLANENSVVEPVKEEKEMTSHSMESAQPSAIVRLNTTDGCRMIVLSVQPLNDQGTGPSSTDTVAFINSRGSIRHVAIRDAFVVNATHANISWNWQGANECEIAFAVQISCISPAHSADILSVSAEYSDWLVGGLLPDTLYTCTLTPFDAQGRMGQLSNTVELQTMIRPPIEAPQIKRLGLKALDNGEYTTIIEWTGIDFGNSTDRVGYKIFIYISETSSAAVVLDMPDTKLIDREQPSARLDGLRLMFKYTVQVAGYNSGGLGPLSEAQILRLGAGYSPFASSFNQLNFPLLLVFLIFLKHFL